MDWVWLTAVDSGPWHSLRGGQSSVKIQSRRKSGQFRGQDGTYLDMSCWVWDSLNHDLQEASSATTHSASEAARRHKGQTDSSKRPRIGVPFSVRTEHSTHTTVKKSPLCIKHLLLLKTKQEQK